MQRHLEVIGAGMILLSAVHLIFPKHFDWRQQLARLSLINRQMMKVHTFFIALTISLIGLLCLTSSDDLAHTTLGRRICLGLGIFWAIRLYVQFFGYSPKLWRGKPFETLVHIFFTLTWIYFSGVFLWIALS